MASSKHSWDTIPKDVVFISPSVYTHITTVDQLISQRENYLSGHKIDLIDIQ